MRGYLEEVAEAGILLGLSHAVANEDTGGELLGLVGVNADRGDGLGVAPDALVAGIGALGGLVALSAVLDIKALGSRGEAEEGNGEDGKESEDAGHRKKTACGGGKG